MAAFSPVPGSSTTDATWDLQTPAVAGALAVVQLSAADASEMDALLQRLGIGAAPLGGLVLRELLGVDRGIVARWSGTCVHLMPHGGMAVVRGIAGALERAGVARADSAVALATYPEASAEIEAQMLAALARAASPLAIDLLLDQPRRWQDAKRGADHADGRGSEERDRVLKRLIEPPLVVVTGAPNIGKSSLVNALAGRAVSIVADEPGTTRDHVGVLIELAGLVVRWVDTPGLGRGIGPIEREAEALAREIAARADLVLACGDRTAPPLAVESAGSKLTIALRSDLGLPQWAHGAAVSALSGEGLTGLVAVVRDTLVPPGALADEGPWKFW